MDSLIFRRVGLTTTDDLIQAQRNRANTLSVTESGYRNGVAIGRSRIYCYANPRNCEEFNGLGGGFVFPRRSLITSSCNSAAFACSAIVVC
jgi:hypothetical protein